MSVSVSVRSDTSQTARPKLIKFCARRLWLQFGPFLWRCDRLCTSGFGRSSSSRGLSTGRCRFHERPPCLSILCSVIGSCQTNGPMLSGATLTVRNQVWRGRPDLRFRPLVRGSHWTWALGCGPLISARAMWFCRWRRFHIHYVHEPGNEPNIPCFKKRTP